jgi:SAM-dependent methyltransferase
VDARFTGVIDGVIQHSRLRPGQQVLDLGTGTGSVAIRAAPLVVPGGTVTAIDISPEMLATARKRIAGLGLSNISFREGRAEQIPALSGQFDAVLASLSLMYVIERDFPFGVGRLLVLRTLPVTTRRATGRSKAPSRSGKDGPDGDGPRHFINETKFVIGTR